MSRNFLDAIKEMNGGKDTIISDKEYENQEIKESKPKTLLSAFGKTNEFGIIGCRYVKNITDAFINYFNISRRELSTTGIELQKLISSGLFTDDDLSVFGPEYKRFILAPCKSEFESNTRITCVALNDMQIDYPIFFFVYYDKKYQWKAYVPLFENRLKSVEKIVDQRRDSTYMFQRTDYHINACDNMMFYLYNNILIKDIGKIDFRPNPQKNINVKLMRYHIGTINLNGQLSVDFAESKKFYEQKADIFVELSDHLAYNTNDYTDVIAFLKTIDFVKNEKIQNSELLVSENREYLYIKL